MSLRAQAEQDLSFTLENVEEFGVAVKIEALGGLVITESANSPDPLNPKPLAGQVLFNDKVFDVNHGSDIVVFKPSVVLRKSSIGIDITKNPKDDYYYEKVFISIPYSFEDGAPLVRHSIKDVPHGVGSLGFVKYSLVKVDGV